jgi:hypothetical protein
MKLEAHVFIECRAFLCATGYIVPSISVSGTRQEMILNSMLTDW